MYQKQNHHQNFGLVTRKGEETGMGQGRIEELRRRWRCSVSLRACSSVSFCTPYTPFTNMILHSLIYLCVCLFFFFWMNERSKNVNTITEAGEWGAGDSRARVSGTAIRQFVTFLLYFFLKPGHHKWILILLHKFHNTPCSPYKKEPISSFLE